MEGRCEPDFVRERREKPIDVHCKKVFHKHEQYQVTFNADGSITFKSADGTVKVLIPWASDQGEILKQSE